MKHTTTTSSWTAHRAILVSIALVVLTLGLYAPVTKHDFVGYDDPIYVTENSVVKPGLTANGVVWAFCGEHASNWHPLTWFSHMLDCQLYGLNPAGHHATNVLLHCANVVLLFLMLSRITGGFWRSAFVAGMFAWHPLHVESVAWIAERKDVLSVFFGILSMLAYVRYVEASGSKVKVQSSKSNPPPSSILHHPASFYVLSLALFACSLMSKPMLVTLPFVLLLLDVWPLNRTFDPEPSVAADSTATLLIRRAGRLLIEKLPLIALAGASCIVTLFVQSNAMRSLETHSLASRVCNAFVSYFRYIGKALWPTDLAVLYPYPNGWHRWEVAAAVVGLIAVSIWVLRQLRRRPWLGVGWLWFVGTLIPVIGLVQVGEQAMADRYSYFPLNGLFIMLAWSIPGCAPAWRRICVGFAGAWLVTMGVLASTQLKHWQNSLALFTHAVAATGGNAIAHINLAQALRAEGRLDEASAHFAAALDINPNALPAHEGLAQVLESQGKLEQAATHYQAVLDQDPGHSLARNNMGNILLRLGRIDQAVQLYRELLESKPDYADAHYNLGIALAEQKHNEEAISHYVQAIKLQPDHTSAHINVALLYAARGSLADAEEHLREAVRLAPNDAEAHFNLGVVLAKAGKDEEARHHRSLALQLKPDLLGPAK